MVTDWRLAYLARLDAVEMQYTFRLGPYVEEGLHGTRLRKIIHRIELGGQALDVCRRQSRLHMLL